MQLLTFNNMHFLLLCGPFLSKDHFLWNSSHSFASQKEFMNWTCEMTALIQTLNIITIIENNPTLSTEIITCCDIWHSHSSIVEDSYFLGRGSVLLDEWFLAHKSTMILHNIRKYSPNDTASISHIIKQPVTPSVTVTSISFPPLVFNPQAQTVYRTPKYTYFTYRVYVEYILNTHT